MTDSTPPRSLDLDGFRRIGYRPLIVTVNGAQQHYVQAYNVDEGWVERLKRDEMGHWVVCEDGSIVSELVRGVVMVWWG